MTGTEWEFEQALGARETRAGVPDLLVYRKTAENVARFSRAEQLEDARRQWDALRVFWTRYFEDEKGGFKLAFNPFADLDAFEALLEAHLREIIRRRLPARPARAPSAERRIDWWSGSPYLGLQAFDLAHSAVFFGRERAVRDIAEALARRAAAGRGLRRRPGRERRRQIVAGARRRRRRPDRARRRRRRRELAHCGRRSGRPRRRPVRRSRRRAA